MAWAGLNYEELRISRHCIHILNGFIPVRYILIQLEIRLSNQLQLTDEYKVIFKEKTSNLKYFFNRELVCGTAQQGLKTFFACYVTMKIQLVVFLIA